MKLIIDSIGKTYNNGVHALKNISLILHNGMFGLLGPNGAGKSSLMRTLATLQAADSGSIFLDNLNVLEQKTEVRQLLGYLPQDFGVYPKISAVEMLDHVARLKGIRNSKERAELVAELLDCVNLTKDKHKGLGTYSGGMKQRFGIAQALIGDPKLIIVDEPTAGLDPAERNRFYNLLSQLGEKTIVILSTHIVEDVSTLCSNFAIIYKGEVLYTGTPDQAIKSMDGQIFSREIAQHELDFYHKNFRVISTNLKGGRLFIRIQSKVYPGNDFYPVITSLEDVYFHHIGNKVTDNTFRLN
ncbi:ABC transporter ATP-binding protein [Mucilaginibacter gossypii]|uniref:ABC transporter ATP-binding protein n=1 Tax=Mucilaginibacter gossypii TaxID=551996 RepID=UPI000DCF1D15|nr:MULTISPECIES: ABC transporter ATP-binding protein [Mucilaginibacter]QTE39753.1 ABC transporter ATP-binding protein [Mucilaginibacter gossypii]RAV58362.1 ABC transporter ATP-binding protein [Mucilaginibacter rubeus]